MGMIAPTPPNSAAIIFFSRRQSCSHFEAVFPSNIAWVIPHYVLGIY
jgi:hypothetical protein